MSPTADTPNGPDDIGRQIALVRDSGVLGRPGHLTRLFDHLARTVDVDPPPGEIYIAQTVFGRRADFNPGLDAVVRVNIHRLRRKLEDHYLRAGAGEAVQLTIPRGEYRLALQDAPARSEAAPRPEAPPVRSSRTKGVGLSRRGLLGASLGLAALNLGAWGLASRAGGAAADPGGVFDRSPWRAPGQRALPLLVVVGDYYIFADTDERGNVQRLVREFFINSRDELYQHMMRNPALDYRYMDLELSYLPVTVAFALKDLAPLLSERPGTQITGASSLTPQMLRDHDVLYLGYLSGLGPLHDAVFRKARFGLGSSPDELVDRATNQTYLSQGGVAPPPRGLFRDYGYFTTFPGPAGGRISIVAGARDVALAGVAEALTRAETLADLPSLPRNGALEALFEVEGRNGVNLRAKLVSSALRDTADLWTTASPETA